MSTITFNGDKLRERREQAGMSRATLASLVDSSEVSVARWERTEREPSATKFLRVAAILGCRAEDLAHTPS